MTAPRHAVCALGAWTDLDPVERLVRDAGGTGFELDREYSMLEPDARMTDAFDASLDRVNPSWEETDAAAVERHSAVVYVLSPPLRRARARQLSARMRT
jgi:hypothetical protein